MKNNIASVGCQRRAASRAVYCLPSGHAYLVVCNARAGTFGKLLFYWSNHVASHQGHKNSWRQQAMRKLANLKTTLEYGPIA